MKRNYSFIIPVYNRPHEIRELLESFTSVEFEEGYEIVIVEDGSSETSESVVNDFNQELTISYYTKANSGPGDSRNYGMKRAKGNYFIILDSDVIMPPDYLIVVDEFLNNHFVDCFGGADTAHKSFSNLQKAINYTMTSLLTTGGIRGSKKSLQKFEPRSFNMGISKKAFETTKGFSKIHPGEDPDLSLRIENVGFETAFIPSAAVFHKRRISLHKFAVQVEKFGMVRPILTKWHPRAAKLTFWFPTSFILFVLLSILLVFIFSWLFLLPLLTYLIILVVHSFYKIGNIKISLLVVVSVFVQFFGYGWGFLKSNWYISVLKRDPEIQFPQLFFK